MNRRYFIEISYDGKNYHGWQVQPDSNTVQGVVSNCLSKLLKLDLNIIGAGRTDAGVHARQLFAHFDLEEEIHDIVGLIHQLNSFLPNDIAIKSLKSVNSEAHARFDAISREYQYLITKVKDPLNYTRAYLVHKNLDYYLMNRAANILFEFTDFSSFSRSNTQTKTNNCVMQKAEWIQKDDFLIFNIKADRFLRNMVRAIVGTLIDVGLGNINEGDFRKIIKSKDRSQASSSVPAHGLYLLNVTYPKHIWNE